MKSVNRPIQIKKFPEERESWLLSYSDLVTILLCFFVLFYYLEKAKSKQEVEEYNENILETVKYELGLKEFDLESLKDIKKYIENRFGGKDLVQVLEGLEAGNGVKVIKQHNAISIEFPQGNLFNLGGEHLNSQGRKKILSVLNQLKNYQDKIVINIMAYTDSTPVKKNSRQWWKTNEELSAMRALTVQKIFLERGYSPESVYVSGGGVKVNEDQKQAYGLSGDVVETETFNKQRTLSLKLESK